MRLGSTELILILIIAIALFGTNRIAGIGKAMGKSIREFKEEVNADDPAAKKEEDGRSDEKA
jgi:sec-independent protein translocase protein TatA